MPRPPHTQQTNPHRGNIEKRPLNLTLIRSLNVLNQLEIHILAMSAAFPSVSTFQHRSMAWRITGLGNIPSAVAAGFDDDGGHRFHEANPAHGLIGVERGLVPLA